MKKILSLICLAAVSALSLAQTPTTSQQEAKKHSTAPKPVCGPYLQNVTTTSATFMWVSDIDAVAWVEIAPDDERNFYYYDHEKYYDMSGCGIKPVNKIHKVTIDGLQPGTSYRYRIMMKSIEQYYSHTDILYGREYGAPVYKAVLPTFRTLDEDYEEVNFAVVNDIHAKDSVLRRLFADTDRNKGYDFVVFNGDMTSDLYFESKIMDYYLGPASEIFAFETPLYMARGNHEFRGADAIKLLDYFDFPDRKPYYTFKYGKFFFIVMDSGEDKPDDDIEYQGVLSTDPYLRKEAEWLAEVVAGEDFKNAERRIVFSHIPPQIEDGWHGNQNMEKYFLPVLNDAGIDLMLSGHNHEYSFRKAGENNAAFPVLVNSTCERMEIKLTEKKIAVKIYDPDGKLVHEINL